MKKGRISKLNLRVRRSRRLAVLKMLSATGSSSTAGGSGGTSPMTAENAIHDFLTTGRTGRRNAMPDILGEHATESTGDLPDRLEQLTCSAGPNEEGSKAGTSGQTAQRPEPTQSSSTSSTETSGSSAGSS